MWGLSLKFVAKNKPCLVPPSRKDVEEVYLVDVFLGGLTLTQNPNVLAFFVRFFSCHSQTIHGTGIFTYMYHKNKPNVSKYTNPMDDMGLALPQNVFFLVYVGESVYLHLHCQFWSVGLQGGTVQLESRACFACHETSLLP